MNRDYADGKSDKIVFFTGKEIEHTPAFGMNTLFIVGVHSIEVIEKHLALYPDITHIFFGANHSFNPQCREEHKEWEDMITYFLDELYFCSLDIPLAQVEDFNEHSFNEYNRFIPQIRVPVPFVKLWNYNTMIKIDDIDFDYSNPGVWTHSLHKLMNRECFTQWSEYSLDKPID